MCKENHEYVDGNQLLRVVRYHRQVANMLYSYWLKQYRERVMLVYNLHKDARGMLGGKH